MDEFLKQHYNLLTHSVEFIAAITGVLCYKKYKNTSVKYFIWFLVYVALMEIVGSYTRFVANYESLKEYKELLKGTPFEANYWFFTIFWVIGGSIFYTYYFSRLLKSKNLKRILMLSIPLYLISSLVFIINQQDLFFTGRIVFISIAGVVIIMLTVISYLVEILKSDKILNFYKSINFYIATTLIIWYITITPLTFYQMYYSTADWNFVLLKWQIYLFANIFMYLTFSFALIFCSPKHD